MKNINLLDKETIKLIRLYAVVKIASLERECDFKQDVKIQQEGEDLKLFITQMSPSSWGQGDILVTINTLTNNVTFFFQEIDGDNWSKSWWCKSKLQSIDLKKILDEAQPLLIKSRIYNLQKENKKLKERLKTVENENFSLSMDIKFYESMEKTHETVTEETSKKKYYIPILSKIKAYFYYLSLIKEIEKI